LIVGHKGPNSWSQIPNTRSQSTTILGHKYYPDHNNITTAVAATTTRKTNKSNKKYRNTASNTEPPSRTSHHQSHHHHTGTHHHHSKNQQTQQKYLNTIQIYFHTHCTHTNRHTSSACGNTVTLIADQCLH
ncbi:Hypothetical predicted protein, partial [Olea europaea subsp. europaea]